MMFIGNNIFSLSALWLMPFHIRTNARLANAFITFFELDFAKILLRLLLLSSMLERPMELRFAKKNQNSLIVFHTRRNLIMLDLELQPC